MIGTAGMTARAATLAISNLTAGTRTIFAVYGGDANWYGARSDAVTVTVISAGATAAVLTSSATLTECGWRAALSPAVSASVRSWTARAARCWSVCRREQGGDLALAAEDAARSRGTQ